MGDKNVSLASNEKLKAMPLVQIRMYINHVIEVTWDIDMVSIVS